MRVAVLISTFNQPVHLRRTLRGYLYQQRPPDELLIGDDGSEAETAEVIREFGALAKFPVRHFRHEHNGWQKHSIFNRALATTTCDYIIFTDGDCIPRPDYVAAHLRCARPNTFLSGGDYRLPENVTQAITNADIDNGSVFKTERLRELGLPPSSKTIKLTVGPTLGRFLDALNVSTARWGGSNSSTWRAGLLAVNGMDERFNSPGKDDVEMGLRLLNLGYRSKHVRHQAVCLHLYHGKGYWLHDQMDKNFQLLNDTRTTGRSATPHGIKETSKPYTVTDYGPRAS